jgi:NADH-quinone oxidoreductase subunit J
MKPVLFYIMAIGILVFSLMAVSSLRILRAAVYLLFVLIATAGVYFLMNYNFLAALQLTLYAGGIIVLIIFAVMLTSQMNEKLEKPEALQIILGGLSSVFGIGVVLYVLFIQDFTPVISEKILNVKDVANMLISYGNNGYALPFEVISLLLLAAMVAAIIIARKEENKSA